MQLTTVYFLGSFTSYQQYKMQGHLSWNLLSDGSYTVSALLVALKCHFPSDTG